MWSIVSVTASFPCGKQQEGVLEEIAAWFCQPCCAYPATDWSQAVLRIQSNSRMGFHRNHAAP